MEQHTCTIPAPIQSYPAPCNNMAKCPGPAAGPFAAPSGPAPRAPRKVGVPTFTAGLPATAKAEASAMASGSNPHGLVTGSGL